RAGAAGGFYRVVVAVAFDRRQAGYAGNDGRARAPGENQPAPGERTGSAATAQQDPVGSAGSRAADAARILSARADEGNSERTGRAGRRAARDRGSETKD